MAKTDVIRKWQQMPPNVIASESGVVTSTVGVGNADTVDGFHASATAIGNTILALNGDAKLPTSITGDANTVDGYDAAELAGIAEAETVTGLWTFSRGASAPFAVASGAAKVAYLDADKLDGYEASAFPRKAEAAVITGGWTFQADIQLDADLDFLGARSITSNGANNLTLAPAGDLVLDPGGDDVVPALSMDVNLGTAMKRYLSIHAAELWVQNLVAQDVIATIGGRVTVGPTTMLTEDTGSPEMVTNGSFEIAGSGGADVFAGWGEVWGDGQVVDETVVVMYGSHSCKLIHGPDGTASPYVYQAFSVIAGRAYRLTFVSRGDGTNAPRWLVYDVTHMQNITPGIQNGSSGSSGFVRTWYTFVAPTGCSTVRIILYSPLAASSYGYFDVVGLTEQMIWVKHNEPAVNDIFYMEKSGQVEYMKVLSGPWGTGPYYYGVQRDLDGTGANNWLAGDTIVNTGAPGDGTIDLYAQHGILGSGSGPTIVGWVRNSTTFNDMTERWAIGNLNSLYGVGSNNTYGVGLGRYASGKSNVLIDDTSGIQMRSYNTVKFQVQPDGDVFIGSDVSAPASTFLSVFTSAQNYNDESVEAGDAMFGDNTANKANMFWDKSAGQLKFRGGTTPQLYIDTDGTLKAGGGNVFINSSGIRLEIPSTYAESAALRLQSSTDSTISGSVHAYSSTAGKMYLYSLARTTANTSGSSAFNHISAFALAGGSPGVEARLAVSVEYGDPWERKISMLADQVSISDGGLVVGIMDTAPTIGCIHIPNGNLVGTTSNNMSDDTAISFSPANKFGVVLVTGRADNYKQLSALVVYRAYTGPFTLLLAGGTAVEVTTGALLGGTGTDGKFTISAHTDGKIYMNNRLGVAVSIHYVCFSG